MDVNQIKKEITRRLMEDYNTGDENDFVAQGVCCSLLQYIKDGEESGPLNEEIDKFLEEVGAPLYWCNDKEQIDWLKIIARHFYELGHRKGMKEMAERGESYEDKIYPCTDNEGNVEGYCIDSCEGELDACERGVEKGIWKIGDPVIVQIRPKE